MINNKAISEDGKKVKGSKNFHKQVLKVVNVHGKIARTRKGFLDKASFNYVFNNDLICLEDLSIAPRARYNGRMVQDAG
ncbi:MAG: hypothetical protein A6F72_02180 [Cycloclasticus sp. symbiont of Poecilosclerida sp. N]|nr:MAG: hypothetical protein A6F72_02180 [Cycloclasticus sp. symbiont of Poecilosclerida sp. N]